MMDGYIIDYESILMFFGLLIGIVLGWMVTYSHLAQKYWKEKSQEYTELMGAEEYMEYQKYHPK